LSWPSHGSNPQYLYNELGMALPKVYLDFSANINPLGPPEVLKRNWNHFYEEMMVYPDPNAANLKMIIADKEQISVDSILVGNGGAELIFLIARMLAGKKVLLVQPTFSEYETACRANGCEILYHQLKEPDFELDLNEWHSKIKEADAVFVCNPNNPTGVQYPHSTMMALIEECEKHNCQVILDEAFYDFLSEYDSVIPTIHQYSNVIIIRSMTKMFAIPGLRLGYLIARPETIKKLRPFQPHWSVNTIALLSGELLFQEQSFIKKTQEFISKERKRLVDLLKQLDFIVSPSKINFYLLQDPYINDQFLLFEYLLKKGVIPRHTYNFPGLEGRWLRFAIKSVDDNNKLLEVLAHWRHLHH
jgi:threonine-phosphate decarboxylase